MKKRIGMLAVVVLVFGFTLMGCGAFTKVEKISGYLSMAQIVGRSAEGPVPLAVKVNLDNNWENLLSVINSSGVFVNLDLSSSNMTNKEFNPGSNGSRYIVSLVLPDVATSIAGDFDIFTSLRNISFSASADLGGMNPFVGCTSLTFKTRGRGDLSTIENGRALVRGTELISYPSASGDITFNDITAIGRSAFNRTSLESINLPAVTNIGIMAFRECESLHTLNIPSTVSIDNSALANTGDVTHTIIAGQRFETIAANMFEGVNKRKNVTIKVPQSEVENITAMRDAFRGRGWNEGNFVVAAGQNRTIVENNWWGRSERTVWVSNLNNNINITFEGY